MRKLSDKKEDILFRRARITELHSVGFTTDKSIAEELGVSRQTVNSDLRVLRRQANNRIEDFQAKLPYEFDVMITGIKQLLRRNWEILNNPMSTEKAITSASHIILDCYEKLSEQLRDKFYVMDGLNQAEGFNPKLSLEERQMREAAEAEYHRRQAIF